MPGRPTCVDLGDYLAAIGYYGREYVSRVNAARRARGENRAGCPRWARCAKRWVAGERKRGRRVRKLARPHGVEWCQRCIPAAQRLPLGQVRGEPMY